jgi:hypothetical protein
MNKTYGSAHEAVADIPCGAALRAAPWGQLCSHATRRGSSRRAGMGSPQSPGSFAISQVDAHFGGVIGTRPTCPLGALRPARYKVIPTECSERDRRLATRDTPGDEAGLRTLLASGADIDSHLGPIRIPGQSQGQGTGHAGVGLFGESDGKGAPGHGDQAAAWYPGARSLGSRQPRAAPFSKFGASRIRPGRSGLKHAADEPVSCASPGTIAPSDQVNSPQVLSRNPWVVLRQLHCHSLLVHGWVVAAQPVMNLVSVWAKRSGSARWGK